MKSIIIALLGLFVLLQYELWFAKGSLLSAWRLQRQVAHQEVMNAQLKKRNVALQADIHDLKSGKQSVEEHARNDLGMVKPGETFYQVVKSDDHS